MKRRTYTPRAFTLIEILVSIAIIVVLIAVLLPALSAARETANIATCLSNLGELARVSEMYMNDEGRKIQPWYMHPAELDGQINLFSEYIFGGFQHETPNPEYSRQDTFVIPTQNRPYNKYIAPGQAGRSPIKSYICPSDKTWQTPLVSAHLEGLPPLDAYSSWQVNGNSYAINWYWVQGPPWYGDEAIYHNLAMFGFAGEQMFRAKVGGEASRFALFGESMLNYFMYDARPRGGHFGESVLQQRAVGWHRRFSTYSISYLDGHAEHRFVDTRYTDDVGFDVWPTYHGEP